MFSTRWNEKEIMPWSEWQGIKGLLLRRMVTAEQAVMRNYRLCAGDNTRVDSCLRSTHPRKLTAVWKPVSFEAGAFMGSLYYGAVVTGTPHLCNRSLAALISGLNMNGSRARWGARNVFCKQCPVKLSRALHIQRWSHQLKVCACSWRSRTAITLWT